MIVICILLWFGLGLLCTLLFVYFFVLFGLVWEWVGCVLGFIVYLVICILGFVWVGCVPCYLYISLFIVYLVLLYTWFVSDICIFRLCTLLFVYFFVWFGSGFIFRLWLGFVYFFIWFVYIQIVYLVICVLGLVLFGNWLLFGLCTQKYLEFSRL